MPRLFVTVHPIKDHRSRNFQSLKSVPGPVPVTALELGPVATTEKDSKRMKKASIHMGMLSQTRPRSELGQDDLAWERAAPDQARL